MGYIDNQRGLKIKNVIKDLVRGLRWFNPDVMVSYATGTRKDLHGRDGDGNGPGMVYAAVSFTCAPVSQYYLQFSLLHTRKLLTSVVWGLCYFCVSHGTQYVILMLSELGISCFSGLHVAEGQRTLWC